MNTSVFQISDNRGQLQQETIKNTPIIDKLLRNMR